jgi:hypothetical protein
MEGCELMHADQFVPPETDCDDSGLELQIQEEVGEVQLPEISLHAITSYPNQETMQLLGTIRSHGITILVDSGSSHNFVDPTISSKVQLEIQVDVKQAVKVANG